jgi:hypothetical protein
MKRLLVVLFAALGLAVPSFGLDWGATVEDSTGSSVLVSTLGSSTFDQSETLRFWVSQNFGRDASLVLKGNVADALSYGFAPGPFTNTFTADLDTLLFSGWGLTVGRTMFRDFGGTVLNTTLDGVQYTFSIPGIDLTMALATSAGVFQDQSTVVISQADLTDRAATRDWANLATYLAPPRAMAYFETAFSQLVTDQTFRVAEIAQYDFRQSVAVDGGKHDPTDAKEPGAPVSMSYTGLGGGGRIVGPLYWNAWAYAGVGTTLTPVGTFKKGKPAAGATPAVATVYQTWKPAWIVNGIGNVDFTVLLPQLSYTIVNLGVQAGSWDPDGISPDQNLPSGTSPSLYTGYFGVSRTGAALIFNPQPVNMVTTQLLYSFKPFAGDRNGLDNFQVAASGYVFVRPTAGAITESGLDAKSSALYLASEADVNLLFRPASDWGGNVSFGALFPNSEALTRGTEFKVQLGLNLSF